MKEHRMIHALGNRKDIFMIRDYIETSRPLNKEVETILPEVEEAEAPKRADAIYGKTTKEYKLNLRKRPDATSEIVTVLDPESDVEIIDFTNSEWVEISYETINDSYFGYVKREFIDVA